jgi:hypothetical protein
MIDGAPSKPFSAVTLTPAALEKHFQERGMERHAVSEIERRNTNP